jgi:hypothetical protein
MIAEILGFVKERLAAVRQAPPSDYRRGSIDQLEEVEEFIEDLEWREGVDSEEL